MTLAANPEYATVKSLPKRSDEVVDGVTYNLVSTGFTWDNKLANSGSISYWIPGGMLGQWWFPVQKDDAEWQAFIPSLEALSTPFKTWSTVTVYALITDSDTPPTVRVPIPALEYARMQMAELAEQTVAGDYFANVTRPADIEAYREQMLNYGNTGRRDPDFRKDNGSQTATDLTLDMVDTLGGSQKVFRTSDTPPFFPDHVLDDKLNQAAQFQAEYNASIEQATHDGPTSWTDPATGKQVNMYGLGDRLRYFDTVMAVEGAGQSQPGGAPHNWMKSETHFRPWFNVDKCTILIGYGAAQSAKGNWYFVAVPEVVDDCDDSTAPTPTPGATPDATAEPAADVTAEATAAPAQEATAAPTEAATPEATPDTVPDATASVSAFPMQAGTAIEQGVEYPSESGNHYLVFQPDGNLVVYDKDDNFVWGLNEVTDNYAAAKTVEIQSDGNLNVIDENGDWVWSALEADPDASAFLTLSPEGALQLVSGDTGKALWASDGNLDAVVATPDTSSMPDVTPAPIVGFPMPAGTTIVAGEKYPSPSGDHYLILQPDGNVAIYAAADDAWVWDLQTETGNTTPAVRLELQSDGNLVATGDGNEYLWSALTENSDASAFLTLSPEGALQLVSGSTGAVLWASDGDLDAVVDVPAPDSAANVTVTDADGNEYATVQIGNQLWMAENLRAVTCSDGTAIPLVDDADEWLAQTAAAYTWSSDVGDDAQLQAEYGALYNGFAAVDSCNVCPVDWRVPSAADLLALAEVYSGEAHIALSDPAFWGAESLATNASGFSARPAGGQGGDAAGSYDFGTFAYLWSSTAMDADSNYLLAIHADYASAAAFASPRYGFSIRCVQDIPLPDAPVASAPAIENPLVITATEGIHAVAWSPDGSKIATGDWANLATVWDAATGASLQSFSGHTLGVDDVAWSPDGATLATASWDQSIRTWDTTTGAAVHVLNGLTDRGNGVVWSPDGAQVAGRSYFVPNLYVWDAASGDVVFTLAHPPTGGVAAVAWSPDGSMIGAAPGNDTRAFIWDAATGDNLYTLEGSRGTLSDGAWSPDGSQFAAGGAGGEILVWAAADGSLLQTLDEPDLGMGSLRWSPDGSKIAASYYVTNVIQIWDVATGAVLQSYAVESTTAAAMAPEWSSDGSKIAALNGDNSVLVFDVATGATVETLVGHTGSLYEIAWSPDGTRLASVSEDGTLRIWQMAGK